MTVSFRRQFCRDSFFIMHHPMFTSAAQVDAVAACSMSSVLFLNKDENVEELELPLLAVAQSQLEGNVWSGSVALLEASTSEQLCELPLETGVASLAWCGADGDVLALGCDDGDVRLVRRSADVVFTLVPVTANGSTDEEDATPIGWGHDDVVTGVSGSKVEKTQLATCSWDLTYDESIEKFKGKYFTDFRLIFLARDSVKLWDIGTLDKTVAAFNGHTDLIWGVAMNPMHVHLLCSASQDATVQIWDARHPQSAALVVSTRLPALSVDWHPRQSTVFSVGLEDGVVCTFDVRSPHKALTRQETHGAAVHVVKYSPYHDDLLATGGDDGKAFVTTDSFSSDETAGGGVRELLVGEEKSSPHRDYVRALEWFRLASAVPSSNDKKFDAMLTTGSWDRSVHKWSVAEYSALVMDELISSYSSEETMLAAPPGVPVA